MLQYITEVVQLKIISVGANYYFFDSWYDLKF